MIIHDKKINYHNKEIIVFLTFIFLAFIYCISSFLFDGIPHYNSQDTLFHLNRLKGLKNVLESPVNYRAFDGKGSLVNIFYPWLTMYPMWIIYRISGSYVFAYNVYYVFLTFITLIISYYSVKFLTKEIYSSFCFAVLYTFSSYRFADVFKRAALGESISIAVLPFVFCSLFAILFVDYKKWINLSIGMAFLAYSHLLSLYLTSCFVFVLFIFLVFKTDHIKKSIKSFILSIILSILLSAGVLIPVIETRLLNDIFLPGSIVNQTAEEAHSLFDIIHNSILNKPNPYNIGFTVILVSIIAVSLIAKFKNSKDAYLEKVLVALSAIVLCISSSVFPWKIIGELSLFKIIQFPCRLNSYISLFVFLCFALLISREILNKDKKIKTIVCVLTVIISACLYFLQIFSLYKEKEMLVSDDFIENAEVTYIDYSPMNSYYSRLYDWNSIDNCYSGDKIINAEKFISNDGTYVVFKVSDITKGTIIDLPVYWYSTVSVIQNGQLGNSFMSDRGTVSIVCNMDGDSDIVIYNQYSKITQFTRLFSFIVLLGLMTYLIYSIRRDAKQRSKNVKE